MTEPEVGPLSQMMIDNGDIIDAAIEAYGPSGVAEFFVNVGTGIAQAYSATTADPDAVTAIQEGTDE
jgi:hypothetical protein